MNYKEHIEECNSIKKIILEKDKVLLIDDEDYEWLNQYEWTVDKNNYVTNNSKGLIHRLIMKPPKGMEIDHKDGNRLNNQKENLRICTRQQNARNRQPQGGSSQYKGVYWDRDTNAWSVGVYDNHKKTYLGLFSDEIAAANCYNYHVEYLYKEYANLNKVPYMKKTEWQKYRRKGYKKIWE